MGHRQGDAGRGAAGHRFRHARAAVGLWPADGQVERISPGMVRHHGASLKMARSGLPVIVPVTEFRDTIGAALTNIVGGTDPRDGAEEGDGSVPAGAGQVERGVGEARPPQPPRSGGRAGEGALPYPNAGITSRANQRSWSSRRSSEDDLLAIGRPEPRAPEDAGTSGRLAGGTGSAGSSKSGGCSWRRDW